MKNNILITILTYLGILLIMINYSICLKYGFSETLAFFGVTDFVDIYNLITDDVDIWYNKFNSTYKVQVPSSQGTNNFIRDKKDKRSFFKQFITLAKRYAKTIINDKQMLLLLFLQH